MVQDKRLRRSWLLSIRMTSSFGISDLDPFTYTKPVQEILNVDRLLCPILLHALGHVQGECNNYVRHT